MRVFSLIKRPEEEEEEEIEEAEECGTMCINDNNTNNIFDITVFAA